MWLFTKYGFFSVTQHAKRADNIQIRARARQDLQQLKDGFPQLDRNPIVETLDADYRFRIVVQRWKWELIGAALTADIDYSNFKGKIGTLLQQRGKLPMLHQIWHLCHEMQERLHPRSRGKQRGLFESDDRQAGDRLIREDGTDDEFIIEHGRLMDEMLAEDEAARKAADQ